MLHITCYLSHGVNVFFLLNVTCDVRIFLGYMTCYVLHLTSYVLHVTCDISCKSFIILWKQGTKSFARDF